MRVLYSFVRVTMISAIWPTFFMEETSFILNFILKVRSMVTIRVM